MKNVLGFWTLFIKSIGLVLSVASGLNLGKEGPMVHIACCWGNVLSRIFPKFASNEVKKREILSASAAAGVSVAFGAPLGGVLFSLEALSSYFPPKTMWRSFWCAIAAALLLQWLDPFNTGKLVQFQITYHHQWSYFELLPFAALGALGGLVGAFIVHWAVRVGTFRRTHPWLRAHPIREVIALAMLTSLLNFSNIYVRSRRACRACGRRGL
jgi:chloride channel 3/4/5